jgi:hypothetical protein
MIVDEHCMSGVIHQASKFTRHRIAGQQDTRFQRFYLKLALALAFVGLTSPAGSGQPTEHGMQPIPEPKLGTSNDH